MRTAAYIRVSTDEQADKGNSLSEQIERLEAYCVSKGWSKPVLFIDDGYSAKNLKRPAMQSLIDSISLNKFDVVITSKLDRLCRNLLELLQLIKLLEDHNCNYISSSEGFDTTTAAGKMVLQILGAFAEFERGRISERVRDNMLSLAKNTDKALTRTCYGYDVIDTKYVINEEEAKNVRYMFELADEGYGPRKIAQFLNDSGITTKQGKAWDQTNVKRLIKNKTLIGTVEYNKRNSTKEKVEMRDKKDWIIKENNHPAIISAEMFDRVQAKFESRSRARKHADSETYLLTGLMRCKYCGATMKGQTSRNKRAGKTYEYFRYICSSYVSGYGCKYHAVHRDELEQAIINTLVAFANGTIKDVKIIENRRSEVDEEIKSLKNQLTKLDNRMQRNIEAYADDLITKNDLKAATEKVELERNKIHERLSKLSVNKGNQSEFKNNVIKLMDSVTNPDRLIAKESLRTLIHQIEVQDKLVDVTFKV